MKKLISLVIAVAFFTSLQAQYVGDALRFSQNFPTLSARSMSMGGAFSSLGGDFSSSVINPAGLGLYRKSEFVFSPSLSLNSTGSNFYSLHSNGGTDFFGDSNEDAKYQLNMSNIGYVGTYLSGKDKGLVSASYFIGYNRMNNFNRSFLLSGINDSTSLVDAFLQDDFDNDINGTDPDNLNAFGNLLAYNTYMIDVIPESQNDYDTPVLLPVDQSRAVKTRGGVGHYTFGFGLNVSHIWYIGMNMGVYHISLKETTRHTEYDMATAATDFRNFTYIENLDVEGNGFSLSLGTMVRLFKIMRVGATLHLPTFYKIEEVYYTSMNSEFDNGDTYYDSSPDGTFRYKLTTPLRLQGGASVQLGKAGIIAADVEYINYSGMTLDDRDNDMDFRDANDDISNIYRPVLNIKIGGEARVMESLLIRLGGGYYPSAFTSDELNQDASYTELTAGIGYRSSSFFIDFGFSSIFHKEKYVAYSAYNYLAPYNFTNNIGDLDQHTFRFVASMGFRF